MYHIYRFKRLESADYVLSVDDISDASTIAGELDKKYPGFIHVILSDYLFLAENEDNEE